MRARRDVAPSGRRPRRGRTLPMLGAVRLLAVRTARRDVVLLAAWFVVVVLAAVVAVGGPRLATGVLDRAARDAVDQAGRDADVVASLNGTRVDRSLRYYDQALAEVDLPALRGVVDRVVLALASDGVPVTAVNPGAADEGDGAGAADEADGADATADPDAGVEPQEEQLFQVRLALLDEAEAPRVRVVEGTLPPDDVPELAPTGGRADGREGEPAPVPVAVPEAAMAGEDLHVGDVLELASRRMVPMDGEPPTVLVEIAAVVAPLDEGDLEWLDAGPLWTAPERGQAVPLLVGPVAGEVVDAALGGPGHGVVRFVVDPERFDAEVAGQVAAELESLAVDAGDLLPPYVVGGASVSTDLDDVLATYTAASRSAVAQMSVPTVGTAGVVALVLVLLARLVVERRRPVLELERARGAAVGTVVLRLAVEALLVTAAAVAVALAALHWLLPGTTSLPGLVAVVAAATLASPLWGGRLARRAWSGSRAPANRRDRIRLVRRRAAARVVGEVSVLLVAAAAAEALRSRGLLQTTTLDADPFLGAAPLLVALAAAVLALRVYPWPVVAAGLVVRRSRGALGVVGMSRARRALAPLPLLVLTLAVAVGVGGLLLVSTVRTGQVRASWDVAGADASVTAEDVSPVVDRLRAAPGVTEVSAAFVKPETRVDLGNRDTDATVVAVDPAYVGSLARLPGAGDRLDAFADLEVPPLPASDDDDAPAVVVPAVVSPGLAARVGDRGIAISVAGHRTELEVVGTTDHAPRGLGPGPFVFVALGSLVNDGTALPPTVVWAYGPGAAEAATAAAVALPPDTAVATSQADWLAQARAGELVRGVEEMLLAGAAVAGLLAAVGAIATALAGARERGRTLALLRTLGMRPRLGWWLAGVELAPVVLAALVAGALAAAVAVSVLGTSLGLEALVGGVRPPEVAVDGAALVWVGVGAVGLLTVAVAVDALAHRRMRLAEVLRVGETPGG